MSKLILIADAGSTKTEWALFDREAGRETGRYKTPGFNPAISEPESLKIMLREAFGDALPQCAGAEIRYYGAGCKGERAEAVAEVLREVFSSAVCEVESDMLGAARALCGREPGIACILGTGSNSCLYDGEKITANIPPLGYILGDQGSGAVLGKIFLGRLLKGAFSREVGERFAKAFPGVGQAEVIERVYRGERPNAFLASFVPFIAENIDLQELNAMVSDEFRSFIRMNVLPYGLPELAVNFAGSVASVFEPQLRAALASERLHPGRIIKAPLAALTAYHR